MAGATFDRVKVWGDEVLENEDLNAEFDNILNHFNAEGADDYSTNVAQMKLTTDPGEVGSENLATSLAGEIERLRFAIQEIKGTGSAEWYSSPGTSLTDIINTLGAALTSNRIASGVTSGNSSRLVAIKPSGSGTSFQIDGNPTPFVYYINGVQYSIDTDLTISGLSAAPSTNNTATTNNNNYAGEQYTGFLGEHGTWIDVTSAGTEFTSRVGQYVGLRIGASEYAIGLIESSTRISHMWRGCFINSSQAPVPRSTFSNGATITLLRLTWLFANTAGTVAVTYNTPTVSGSQPTSPTTGDYWFDLTENIWKTYNSTTWVDSDSILIGVTVQDSTNCVGAMTFDVANSATSMNEVRMEYSTASTVSIRNFNASANVYGTNVKYGTGRLAWDMGLHLESGLTEAASTFYYLYLKESGVPLISSKAPTDRRGDLGGYYHPEETWRCFGIIFNNASSNFDADSLHEFRSGFDDAESKFDASMNPTTFSLTTSVGANALTVKLYDRIGNYPSDMLPVKVPFRSPTSANGGLTIVPIREIIGATIPASASLGHLNGTNEYIWTYLVNNNGSLQIGFTGDYISDDLSVNTTTALSAGSTSAYVLYAPETVGGTTIRLIARMKSNQTTAGTWASTISEISLWPTPRINVTNPALYTPTYSAGFGTVTNSHVLSWREGKFLHLQATFSGGTVAASAAQISLGFNGSNSNVTIDTGLLGSVAQVVGHFASNGNQQTGNMLYDGSSTGIVAFGPTYGAVTSQISTGNANGIMPPSGIMTFHCRVPILGWRIFGP